MVGIVLWHQALSQKGRKVKSQFRQHTLGPPLTVGVACSGLLLRSHGLPLPYPATGPVDHVDPSLLPNPAPFEVQPSVVPARSFLLLRLIV